MDKYNTDKKSKRFNFGTQGQNIINSSIKKDQRLNKFAFESSKKDLFQKKEDFDNPIKLVYNKFQKIIESKKFEGLEIVGSNEKLENGNNNFSSSRRYSQNVNQSSEFTWTNSNFSKKNLNSFLEDNSDNKKIKKDLNTSRNFYHQKGPVSKSYDQSSKITDSEKHFTEKKVNEYKESYNKADNDTDIRINNNFNYTDGDSDTLIKLKKNNINPDIDTMKNSNPNGKFKNNNYQNKKNEMQYRYNLNNVNQINSNFGNYQNPMNNFNNNIQNQNNNIYKNNINFNQNNFYNNNCQNQNDYNNGQNQNNYNNFQNQNNYNNGQNQNNYNIGQHQNNYNNGQNQNNYYNCQNQNNNF